MTLVTTAGASNAESYASVAEADAYFTARGITTWTGATAVKEAALRRGTTYLDNQYRARWVGYRSTLEQSLAWPRYGDDQSQYTYRSRSFWGLFDSDGWAIPTNIVPVQVKNAAIEAALLVVTGVTLEPRLDRGGQIKSISKGLGPLSKSITYADGAPAVDRYVAIEGLLRGLVTSTPGATSGTVQMMRG